MEQLLTKLLATYDLADWFESNESLSIEQKLYRHLYTCCLQGYVNAFDELLPYVGNRGPELFVAAVRRRQYGICKRLVDKGINIECVDEVTLCVFLCLFIIYCVL
jgi:hypothetical protein